MEHFVTALEIAIVPTKIAPTAATISRPSRGDRPLALRLRVGSAAGEANRSLSVDSSLHLVHDLVDGEARRLLTRRELGEAGEEIGDQLLPGQD